MDGCKVNGKGLLTTSRTTHKANVAIGRIPLNSPSYACKASWLLLRFSAKGSKDYSNKES